MGYKSQPDTRFFGGLQKAKIGLFLGIAVFVGLLFVEPPDNLNITGWHVAIVVSLMAIWWITEAIPVYATGLVPLCLFPLMNVSDFEATAAPYANPLIFLFMGGFMIALAMQRWNLHIRIALNLLLVTGTRERDLIGGFMLVAGFLSMWVSNTATTMMMLPICLSVITLMQKQSSEGDINTNFSITLLLGVAYGATIGGLATLIGTAPNALLAGYFYEAYGINISFLQWMSLGFPLSMLLLFVSWFLLTRLIYPMQNRQIAGMDVLLSNARSELGRMSQAEKSVAFAFISCALLWVLRPMIQDILPDIRLSDAGISMTMALCLFIVPSGLKGGGGVLNWEWASKLPWGVLLLFGGGLSLAAAASSSGLSVWIANGFASLEGLSTLLLILFVVSIVVFLTEFTSNTATTATLLPLLAATAIGIGENPLLFCIPAAFAASCAFMLPAATPPNAIVFGSGFLTIPQMVRAGLYLNCVGIVILSIICYFAVPIIFGVVPGEVPDWAILD